MERHGLCPTPALWDEAQSFGLRFGWAQASLDALGTMGMLSLARSHGALTAAELDCQEHKMRWLAQLAHFNMLRIFTARLVDPPFPPKLTAREVEVLQWTADGKTSADIADLLELSRDTVNFHIKNAITKLQTSNKTAATVRAAMLGLLHP